MHKKISHYTGRLIDILVYPLIPPKYRLAFQYWKSTLLHDWEPETKYIREYGRKGDWAVDVGANIGLWSYAMAKSGMFKQVLSFEPNPDLTGALKDSGIKNITLVHKAVSNVCGSTVLRIPIQDRFLLDGWASLESNIDLDTNEFKEISVEVIRLDDLNLSNVGFIKIDVEGHELSLLNGAHEFLTENRPVCIIECRDRNKTQVEEFFASLRVGYKKIDTKKKYGFTLSGENMLFELD